MNAILIIDDDQVQRKLMTSVLQNETTLKIYEAANGQQAMVCLEAQPDITIAILDLEMPVMNGLETLPILKKDFPKVSVIVVAGTRKAEDAARSIQFGADDFFSKPVRPARLLASVRNILEIQKLSNEVASLKKETGVVQGFDDLIGTSSRFKLCIDTACKMSLTDFPILITGETGTGKEVFAKAIHGESSRCEKPFIAVNCGAIPEKLIESILFGHEKGAFTGAVSQEIGKFREADGGTIFLDEIGDLPLEAQVKILRVLQEQEVEPVGSGKSVKVDVRIISATHHDLEKKISTCEFREDLYFRLNVLSLNLPPLRHRADDLDSLIDYFLEKGGKLINKTRKVVSLNAMRKLKSHDWPGNVRELENTINRALVMSEGNTMRAQDVVFLGHKVENGTKNLQDQGNVISILDSKGELLPLDVLENEFFKRVIAHYDGNITKAAKKIGIAKSTLYRKLNQRV